MSSYREVWQRLSKQEKMRSLFAGTLCMWGLALVVSKHACMLRGEQQQQLEYRNAAGRRNWVEG